MVRPLLTAVLVLAWTGPAWGEIFRCERDGQVIYSDRPCSANGAAYQPPPATVVPAGEGTAALAREHDARRRQQQNDRDKADRKWLQEHEARRRHEARIRKALIDGRVITGMTAAQVRSVLGEPSEVTRQERDGVLKERWVYREGRQTRTVNFKDGYVTSSGARRQERK